MCIRDRTIEVTPYEAQLGKKPTRVWEKYINKDVLLVKGVDHNQIFIKMKEKREKQAKLCNETKTITRFNIGEKVLIRTYHQSDAVQKRIEKFCELYCGPYKVHQILGEATYLLVDCDDDKKLRGKFNARQLKKYYESEN